MLRNTSQVLAWFLAVNAALTVPVHADQIVIASAASIERSGERVGVSAGSIDHICEMVTIPPVRLETQSKYDQTVMSKSIVDDAASRIRRQKLAPIDDAIRRLEVMAVDTINATRDQSTECVGRNLEAWAAAGALTDMATSDANLSRDRFMASIAGLLMESRARGRDFARQSVVRPWLRSIADQTIRYYDRNAGSISRRNNHRYWAGLSVGRIGYLLDDEGMLSWSRSSLDIGLCQVDRDGFLPLELARGKKAFDYHLYAFVALRSLSALLSGHARVEESSCSGGLERLQARIESGLTSIASFETRSGYRQDTPSRRNLLTATRLSARSQAATGPLTSISY